MVLLKWVNLMVYINYTSIKLFFKEINLSWIIDINVKGKTIKFLEENIIVMILEEAEIS